MSMLYPATELWREPRAVRYAVVVWDPQGRVLYDGCDLATAAELAAWYALRYGVALPEILEGPAAGRALGRVERTET